MTTWPLHVERWGNCTLCRLCEQRKNICLARGDVPCDVLFIGEAPGSSEDELGEPFVGPAGHRLDRYIIAPAIPDGVFMAFTNLVCCFPREAKQEGFNEPERSEILACKPRLIEFVNIAQPRLIVCVGSLAREYVDHGDTVPCIDIIHPAATFPPRMSQAQAQIELQKACVRLRTAVQKIMAEPQQEFREWGTSYANQQKRNEQYRRQLDEAITKQTIRDPDEIPW